MNDQNGQSRVVIVGGGFAGLFAARMLARAPVQVTLIDRAEHHLFQPMLYQCATGILSEGKIAAPLRQLLAKHRNVEFVIAEATGLDAAGRRVLARRPLGEQVDFGYDYLILAAGVRQSYFGHDEYAPIAPGMKTIEDAMKIRRRIFGAFEMAESADDPAERARWLTFALVGAGPTGVELAGQIREVATKTLRSEYRHIKPEDARVLLFDGGERAAGDVRPEAVRPGRPGPGQARGRAAHGLDRHPRGPGRPGGQGPRRHGDPARVRQRAVDRGRGGTAAGHRGGQGHRRAAGPGRADRGRQGPGHPRPSGDPGHRGRDEPGQAARRRRSGHADRAVRRAQDRPPGPGQSFDKQFKYRDLGSAAYISRGKAVVSAFKLNFGGFLGWWVWLFIHIGFLTGYRNRIGAVLGWWFAFTRDIRRERTFTIDDIPLVAGQPYGSALGPSAAAAPVRSADPRDAGAG